jgi:hypothetical protein
MRERERETCKNVPHGTSGGGIAYPSEALGYTIGH